MLREQVDEEGTKAEALRKNVGVLEMGLKKEAEHVEALRTEVGARLEGQIKALRSSFEAHLEEAPWDVVQTKGAAPPATAHDPYHAIARPTTPARHFTLLGLA